MSWDEDVNIYSDPTLSLSRKGYGVDPYRHIIEPVQIVNGKALLKEIPDRLTKVKVTGADIQWFEVEDSITNNNYYQVDYTQGVVSFNIENEGLTLNFEYFGRGVLLLPDSRMYVSDTEELQTGKEKFADLDRADLEQKNRVDTLIIENPQPSEVVDLRIDYNGKVYRVARDRINAEQVKVEKVQKEVTDARMSMDGVINRDLITRLDKDFNKLQYEIDVVEEDLADQIAKEAADFALLTSRIDATDAVVAQHEKKLARVVDVMTLGAVGDGVTDDTNAFQNAINLATTFKAVTIKVPTPPKQYILTRELVMRDNVTIICEPGAVMIRKHQGYMIINGDRATPAPRSYGNAGNFNIYGGTWDANGVVQIGKASIFHFGHGHDIQLVGVTLKNARESHHLELNACKDVIVRDCKFLGYIGQSAFVEAVQFDIAYPTLNGNQVITLLPADSSPCYNITVDNCFFGNSPTSGAQQLPRGIGSHNAIIGRTQQNIKITNCTFENTLNYAIRTYNWEHVMITGNKLYNCGSGITVSVADVTDPKDTKTPDGTQTNGAEVNRNIIISQNKVVGGGAYYYPILILGDPTGRIVRVTIDHNQIIQDSSSNKKWSGIYLGNTVDFTVDNNIISGVGDHGVLATSGCVDGSISFNQIKDCSTHGISVEGKSQDLTVVGNKIKRAGRSGILFTGVLNTTLGMNSIVGVNGNPVSGDDDLQCVHIKLIDACKRIAITGNTTANYSTSHVAKNALYITQTCDIISRAGNNFSGYAVLDGSTKNSNGADLV